MSSIIPAATAATHSAATTSTAVQHAPAGGGFLWILVAIMAVFVFFSWRSQSKRQKQQKEFMSSLTKGEEVITTGGLYGKIDSMDEENVFLTISEGVNIRIKKASIANSLPKGSIK